MKRAATTGLMTKPTNREEPRTAMSVNGRYFMNSPIMLFQKRRGKKAANVVAVEEMIGTAISPTPSLAAWNLDLPSENCR